MSTSPPSLTGDHERAMLERRARLLGPAYRVFYERPVHLVRGEGAWLYGADGERYLDAYNNVACVGHAHPHVVAALARQAAKLNTHTRYLDETILAYAERLLARFPVELGQVMFTCTGSEANDLALRIARAHTGGEGVVVTRHAYHGVTQATAECSPSLGRGVAPGPRVWKVPAPDGGDDSANAGRRLAAEVDGAVAAMRREGVRPAALLVDTILSSDGVRPEPAGFLAPAADAIRAAGGLFIADEVQAGFGRIGERFWGFARHGVVPDLVTMGKPMGNGHPLAGVVARPEVLRAFGSRARYFNTFGGSPVSCAVGMAVLEVLERESLAANAARVGAELMRGLREIAARDGRIAALRGAGLFVGVELRDAASGAPSPDLATRVVNGLRERRVLISATGAAANVLKIRPPLVFTTEQSALLLEALSDTLRH
jgi:4-aminobutyrate aminotransferase-like enzyme